MIVAIPDLFLEAVKNEHFRFRQAGFTSVLIKYHLMFPAWTNSLNHKRVKLFEYFTKSPSELLLSNPVKMLIDATILSRNVT